ncbi:MAG: glycosyltransferase family 2 protein [Thermodesulfovibrionia bacterium]|nr:glycosyltransferase family 2 protein [Thermodesulfovibrionia bacterium]
MKILIVIPAFNEAENIGSVISDLKQHFPKGVPVIINDGSSDNTSSIGHSMGVRVIDLPFNIGIGGAVQTGLQIAAREGYDVAVQFDGDGQHMAEEIEKILKPVSEGVDFVSSSRFLEDSGYVMPVSRKIGSLVFSFVISIMCRQKLTDTTSGFRAFGRRAIDYFSRNYPEDYPEVEALIIAHKRNLVIKEVPVKMRSRSEGVSSITPLRSVYYMVKVLLAVFIDLLKK